MPVVIVRMTNSNFGLKLSYYALTNEHATRCYAYLNSHFADDTNALSRHHGGCLLGPGPIPTHPVAFLLVCRSHWFKCAGASTVPVPRNPNGRFHKFSSFRVGVCLVRGRRVGYRWRRRVFSSGTWGGNSYSSLKVRQRNEPGLGCDV